MKNNRFTGEEVVVVGKDKYLVKCDFAFTQALEDSGYPDLAALLDRLGAGHVQPSMIRDVIKCALKLKNGKEIDPQDLEAEAAYVATVNGMQESWALCMTMIDLAFYGAAKKQFLFQPKVIVYLMLKAKGLTSLDSWKQPYPWVYLFLTSGISACTAFLALKIAG